MSATITSKPSAAGSLLGATWVLDAAHTHLEFAVKHLMIATVKGRFAKVEGSARLDASKPFQPELRIQIDTASLDTREEQRDTHLRSADFFDVDNHPSITFVGRKMEGDINGKFRLFGDLTIRGVTKPVVLNAKFEGRTTDPWGNEKIGFSATGKVDRLDYGLQWNVALEAGGVLVGEEVKLSIEAEFTRQAA